MIFPCPLITRVIRPSHEQVVLCSCVQGMSATSASWVVLVTQHHGDHHDSSDHTPISRHQQRTLLGPEMAIQLRESARGAETS